MKHDWFPNKYNDGIDIFRYDTDPGHHNGPECRRCGLMECHHCHPEIYEEECPSGQLTID